MIRFAKFQKEFKFYQNENGKVLYMVSISDTTSSERFISFNRGVNLIISQNLGFYSCLDEDEDLELRSYINQRLAV